MLGVSIVDSSCAEVVIETWVVSAPELCVTIAVVCPVLFEVDSVDSVLEGELFIV